MPYCRHCHKEISKFDTDICPCCGGAKPIADGYKTIDVTRTFDAAYTDAKMPKTRSQKAFCVLTMTLGYFGVGEFYIYRPKRALFCLISTLIVVSGGGSALFFSNALRNALAFVLPFLGLWLIYVVAGIVYLKVDSPKDGKGDFLR